MTTVATLAEGPAMPDFEVGEAETAQGGECASKVTCLAPQNPRTRPARFPWPEDVGRLI